MLDLDVNSLNEYFENVITEPFYDLVNPFNAVGSVSGETEGIFGYEKWEECTASKLVAISTAVSIIYGGEGAGIDFSNSVFEYIKNNIGIVSEEDILEVSNDVSCISNCAEGSMAKTIIYSQLKNKGFFDDLKAVYATLEILVSMVINDDLSLPTESKDELNEFLSGQIVVSEEKRDRYKFGMKFNRAKYQLNKFHAVLDNLDGSYQEVSELLDGLDVSGVQSMIIDKDIPYIKLWCIFFFKLNI